MTRSLSNSEANSAATADAAAAPFVAGPGSPEFHGVLLVPSSQQLSPLADPDLGRCRHCRLGPSPMPNLNLRGSLGLSAERGDRTVTAAAAAAKSSTSNTARPAAALPLALALPQVSSLSARHPPACSGLVTRT